jgi:hypothetical protein
MITYKQFILEARQRGSLYHYTSLEGVNGILNNNEIKVPVNAVHVSLTRNKNLHTDNTHGGYPEESNRKKIKPSLGNSRHGVPTDVSLEINGNKLSNKRRIKPFQYSTNQGTSFNGLRSWDNKHNYPESEERVEGNIPNIKKYITKIRVHAPIHQEHLKELESHGIPIEHTYKK